MSGKTICCLLFVCLTVLFVSLIFAGDKEVYKSNPSPPMEQDGYNLCFNTAKIHTICVYLCNQKQLKWNGRAVLNMLDGGVTCTCELPPKK